MSILLNDLCDNIGSRSFADPSTQILSSQLFDALWDSISRRLKLPKSCTARFVPDTSLIQFEAPSDDELEDGVVDGVGNENNDGVNDPEKAPPTNNHNSRQSSPDIVGSASGSATPEELLERARNMPTPAQLAARMAALPMCEVCSCKSPTTPCKLSR